MEYVTAGESHGPALVAIVSGVPAGLKVSKKSIDSDLARRQSGYGRGGRQKIETDQVEFIGGVRFGKTIGSPVSVMITNKDHYQAWLERMSPTEPAPANLVREVTPRPGHADLVGALKTDTDDCRNILERSSARETAARVAAAGIAREFLAELGVEIFSYVTRIGDAEYVEENAMESAADIKPLSIELSEVRCPNKEASARMKEAIDKAKAEGDSLGGTFRVVATGLIPGLGSYVSGSERLTSKLAAAVFSIPAIKGVEFGIGFDAAALPGSQVHDPINLTKKNGFVRPTNNAGGLEGGMTNGMPLIITAAMKPIPTLMKPLDTINLDTLETVPASSERSDTCAVPAAAVVAEAEVAFVLAQAYLDKFGCDNMTDIKASIKAYKQRLKAACR